MPISSRTQQPRLMASLRQQFCDFAVVDEGNQAKLTVTLTQTYSGLEGHWLENLSDLPAEWHELLMTIENFLSYLKRKGLCQLGKNQPVWDASANGAYFYDEGKGPWHAPYGHTDKGQALEMPRRFAPGDFTSFAIQGNQLQFLIDAPTPELLAALQSELQEKLAIPGKEVNPTNPSSRHMPGR